MEPPTILGVSNSILSSSFICRAGKAVLVPIKLVTDSPAHYSRYLGKCQISQSLMSYPPLDYLLLSSLLQVTPLVVLLLSYQLCTLYLRPSLMARTKSPAMRREPSEVHSQSNGVVRRDGYSEKAEKIPAMLDKKLASNGKLGAQGETVAKSAGNDPPGILNLIISVGGIYGAL